MTRIICFVSSHKIGLGGQLTEQAICLNKIGKAEFLFISGENEQFPGLFDIFRQNTMPHLTINGLDEHKNFLHLVKDFRKIATSFCPDFVEVHTNWQLAIAVVTRLFFKANYSIVYVIHGYRHNYYLRSIIARFIIGSALLLFADHVIAPSSFLKKKFGFLKEKVKVIFIGEDESFFNDYPLPVFEGKLRFIFAGMFRPGKNQEFLIRVIKKYIEVSGNKDVELYLPGDGPLLEKCRSLSNELGLEEKVVFPGFIKRDAILPLYLKCQFAFVPTNVETFGHCITEPFVLGRVVFSKHTGVADDIITHGETGFFFNQEDDLLATMLKVAPDHDLCIRVAANARKLNDQFRWELICRKRFELIFDKPS